MEQFYNVPVTGIMLENGSLINVRAGSNANNPKTDAQTACQTAKDKNLSLISPQDFALIKSRQKEMRNMLEECKASLALAYDYVWTQNAQTGEMAAYSLVDGSKCAPNEPAAVVFKYK